MGKLFGTDGVRGIANEELTCELALAIGRSVGKILKDGNGIKPKVVVGCDTRISSDMLAASVMAGLCSVGTDSYFLGVASTPAVAFLTKNIGADAGIMISASHNPSEYNGIKIFSSDGFKLPDALESRIETMILMPDKYLSGSERNTGVIINSHTLTSEYAAHLIAKVENHASGIKVALDCSNGSASRTAPQVFAGVGAEISVINAEPDGLNINRNCGSTHLRELRKYVLDNEMDVGFAFDGDADRCLCVDEKGNIIDGDYILAICAKDMKDRGKLKNNTVVGTVMSNFGFSEFCKKENINFIATKVGDRYVLEEMENGDYIVGGEQSGHIIFREYATTGDGQLTALQIISIMKRTGKKLSELSKIMTKYPQELINVEVSKEGKLRYFTDKEIKEAIKQAEKEIGDTGRILVRPSGTEPLIRVMTEGKDKELIASQAKKVSEIIEKICK